MKKVVLLKVLVTVDEDQTRKETEAMVVRALNSGEEVGLNPEATVIQENTLHGAG